MLKSRSHILLFTGIAIGGQFVVGCSNPKPWPESPLYETPMNGPNWAPPIPVLGYAVKKVNERLAYY